MCRAFCVLRARLVPNALLAFLLAFHPFALGASDSPLAHRVLVVYNGKVKNSKKIADAYVAARGIPVENQCALRLSWHETYYLPYNGTVSVPAAEWDKKVRDPIRKCLDAVGRQKILYIVLTMGTPYKITDVPRGSGVSSDQYLADIWGDASTPPARVVNPYHADALSLANRYPPLVSLADYRARSDAKTIYSVWRLDAPSEELALGLIQKALDAEKNGLRGQACFDRRFGPDMTKKSDFRLDAGEWDLYRAAQMVRDAGIPVLEDTKAEEFGTPPAPPRCDNAMLYAGWYALDHYNDAFTWNPGAIGFHLDSLSASNPRGGKNWSAGALQNGITVTAGALDEPDLFGLPHPDGVFRNLLEGANVGDAFLRNTRWLRWMIIYIGDPLYRPFPGGRLSQPSNTSPKRD